MEQFKELFFSCQECFERHLDYNIVTILISIFAGMIFLMFRASNSNDTGIESECNNEDFFVTPG